MGALEPPSFMPTTRQQQRKTSAAIRSRIQGGLQVATITPSSVKPNGTITADNNLQFRDLSFYLVEQGQPITAVSNPNGVGFYVD